MFHFSSLIKLFCIFMYFKIYTQANICGIAALTSLTHKILVWHTFSLNIFYCHYFLHVSIQKYTDRRNYMYRYMSSATNSMTILGLSLQELYMRACVRSFVRSFVRACVRACVCVCVWQDPTNNLFVSIKNIYQIVRDNIFLVMYTYIKYKKYNLQEYTKVYSIRLLCGFNP